MLGTYTDGSLSGVDVGDFFTGSFVYESTTPADEVMPGWDYYAMGHPSRISAVIGGHLMGAGPLTVMVTDADSGDNVFVYGDSVLVDGARYEQGSFGLFLHDASGQAVNDSSLPTSYEVRDYNSLGSWQYGALRRDGTEDGGILTFSLIRISQVSAVPEPSTWLSMLLGIGLLGALARRRRSA